jgi:uncharacterized membrane protein
MAMKALTFAMTICSALSLSSVDASHAQQQSSSTFQIAFCNMSDYSNILVALVHKKDAQNWAVDGWYPVPDGGCAPAGNFLRDTIYYFAYSGEGAIWRPADDDQAATAQCIDYNKWFQGAAAGVSACPAGQQTVRFKMITIPANLSRLTWTLTGSKQ